MDASVMKANASRYYGKTPEELGWTDAQRQKRAVAEYIRQHRPKCDIELVANFHYAPTG